MDALAFIILILCFAGLSLQFPQGDLQALDVVADTSKNDTNNGNSTKACETARGIAGSCVDRQFCEYSTSAIDLTLYAPKGYNKLLWIALSITAFAGAVFCALSQFSRYNQEPVVVSLQRDYRRWQTNFPAVTACFLERINPEKAKEAIEKYWNVTEESNPDRFQYYTEFLELVTDVSFRENLQNFWKYQDDVTVGGINLLQLALSVHPVADLSVRMSHRDKEVTWHVVMTEMGLCLSLNSEYAEYQHINDTQWTQEELLSCHYLSGQCYVRIDSIDNAIRFFIHSPFEIATAVSNPTGEIEPGEELIIDFKAVEIQAAASVRVLTTEQRRCRYHDEWISPSVKAYSFALCQMHCRSRLAIMFCGCRPFFHVKGASLGGTTALFVGASVLTVVETALYIVRSLLEAVYRRVHRIQYKP